VADNKPSVTPQPAAVPASAPVVDDALSVSSTAYFIALARTQIAKLPDVRTEKVEALKAKMDSDDYNPDPEAVADGLVREHQPPLRD
jgi:negative regulator of flagellin synthesis FlgM